MEYFQSPVASRRLFREIGRTLSTAERVRANCFTSDSVKGYYCREMDLSGTSFWVIVRIRDDDGVDIVGLGRHFTQNIE